MIRTVLACLLLSACSIPLDKGLHVAAGSVAYGAQKAIMPGRMRDTPLQRCALATAAGIAKEAYDATGRGHVEAADLAVTVGGCLLTDLVVEGLK